MKNNASYTAISRLSRNGDQTQASRGARGTTRPGQSESRTRRERGGRGPVQAVPRRTPHHDHGPTGRSSRHLHRTTRHHPGTRKHCRQRHFRTSSGTLLDIAYSLHVQLVSIRPRGGFGMGFFSSQKIPKAKSHKISNPRDWDFVSRKIPKNLTSLGGKPVNPNKWIQTRQLVFDKTQKSSKTTFSLHVSFRGWCLICAECVACNALNSTDFCLLCLKSENPCH